MLLVWKDALDPSDVRIEAFGQRPASQRLRGEELRVLGFTVGACR